jgi:hypothetical protein
LQQRQHIRSSKKARQDKREYDKKRRKDRKYDSLLPEAPDSHPDYSLFVLLPQMFAPFDRDCKRSRSDSAVTGRGWTLLVFCWTEFLSMQIRSLLLGCGQQAQHVRAIAEAVLELAGTVRC